MELLHRRDDGRALRNAMEKAGLSIPELARATRAVDPAGEGISPALVGRLATDRPSGKDTCRLRSAWLIADALGSPLQSLFAMPTTSTETVERSTPDGHLCH